MGVVDFTSPSLFSGIDKEDDPEADDSDAAAAFPESFRSSQCMYSRWTALNGGHVAKSRQKEGKDP